MQTFQLPKEIIMNRFNARVIEANIPAARATTQRQYGRKPVTVKQGRELDDITEWLEDQDAAEIELICSEMSNRRRASGRRNLNS